MENTIPFWKGTNFWVASIMVIISLFGGGDGIANTVVMSVSGVIAAFFAVRQFINSAKFGGWYKTLVQGNTLNYLAQVLILVGIPNVEQLVPPLKDLIDAFVQKNWGLVISRVVSLATIVFYLFVKKPAVSA